VRTGPVIIGFDGTTASVQAVREAGPLFAPRTALVVFVWAAGRTFEEATLPERGALEEPGGVLDFDNAFGAERAASDEAQQLAEQGAALARKAGLQADGLAVPHDATVADTLIRLAREHDAQALVVGMHERHRLGKLAPTRTLADLLHAAPCPVVICGAQKPE
jgi:nucleotide-binding universal stress UspA family protein